MDIVFPASFAELFELLHILALTHWATSLSFGPFYQAFEVVGVMALCLQIAVVSQTNRANFIGVQIFFKIACPTILHNRDKNSKVVNFCPFSLKIVFKTLLWDSRLWFWEAVDFDDANDDTDDEECANGYC